MMMKHRNQDDSQSRARAGAHQQRGSQDDADQVSARPSLAFTEGRTQSTALVLHGRM